MGSRVVAVIEAATVTGPAKNLLRFAARARNSGAAEVSILTFCRLRSSNPFLEAVYAAGLEADVIEERRRFDPRVVGQLRAALHRRSPNIVQTHGVKSHFLLRAGCPQRSHRWIAFHHGYTDENLQMRLYNQLDRWSLRGADRVVTVCRPFAEVLARLGVPRERLQVLPNAIEAAPRPSPEVVGALRRNLGIPVGRRVILSIGRFSREKAHADLIAATEILSRRRPAMDVQLVLVGDGPERSNLERIAAAAGLQAPVIFIGHQRDVQPFYGMADLFVLPSHSEGSPNVVLEAMSAGVAVVATAVGGVPEMLESEETALLTPPSDPVALAGAMIRVLSDPPLAARLANNAGGVLRSRFSPEVYQREVLRMYANVRDQQQQTLT